MEKDGRGLGRSDWNSTCWEGDKRPDFEIEALVTKNA